MQQVVLFCLNPFPYFDDVGKQKILFLQCASQIFHNHTLSPSRVLKLVDDISNRVCVVLDNASLLRSVHPNPKFTAAAEQFGVFFFI